jgi:hypothetical protein
LPLTLPEYQIKWSKSASDQRANTKKCVQFLVKQIQKMKASYFVIPLYSVWQQRIAVCVFRLVCACTYEGSKLILIRTSRKEGGDRLLGLTIHLTENHVPRLPIANYRRPETTFFLIARQRTKPIFLAVRSLPMRKNLTLSHQTFRRALLNCETKRNPTPHGPNLLLMQRANSPARFSCIKFMRVYMPRCSIFRSPCS